MRGYTEKVYLWDDKVQREFFEDRFRLKSIQIIQSDGQDVGMYELLERENDYFLTRIEILPEITNRLQSDCASSERYGNEGKCRSSEWE